MIAVIMEFLVWLADFLFQKRTAYHGNHWADTVKPVPRDWHPMPELCAYPGLWEARCRGTADYLRAPYKAFKAIVQIAREFDRVIALDNYGWKDVPVNEWPQSWRV